LSGAAFLPRRLSFFDGTFLAPRAPARMSFSQVLRVVVATIAAMLLGVLPVRAQISIAWDANIEPDIAGYIVQYGSLTAPFSQSVDVGNTTTWTLADTVAGTTYSFRVIAYDTAGLQSAPSASVSQTAVRSSSGLTTFTADRAALVFGVVKGSPQLRTPSQTLRLTQAGSGTVSWSAWSNVPWLQISPTSGSGSTALTLTLVPSALPSSSSTATISIASTGASNAIAPIAVALNVIDPASVRAPFGALDTPQDNITGVTGSLAITGWALDDVAVSRIRIYRDPMPGEASGQLVYVGDGTFIEDARPDVTSLFAAYPQSYRAGWGYLALTNVLPGGGNGTYRFYAYADDIDGHSTLLGARTITCGDATAVLPFGTIDTPAPGETASGTNYVNYGWVLANGGARADVPGGGSVSVLIDGVAAGTPAGWTSRSDLSALFQGYSGIDTAVAAFAFDTTKLADGMHTISWVVTDSLGRTAGVGSRFFRVFNPSFTLAQTTAASTLAQTSSSDDAAAAMTDATPIEARRGFALDTEFTTYTADASGSIVIPAEEVDRIEVKTHGATEGYLRVEDAARPLPAGSHLDADTGVFTWQPPAGFVGAYDFTFLHRESGRLVREDVRIVLSPKGS
jgi:fibronectin type III domain protein/BACON domain-containing protein